ncbi:hypothetical protein N7445_006176 [Penicillium cf. griseofulvum]|nr:hypothetical protein N7445_006176 [Penicillium cf. griseofulvum]
MTAGACYWSGNGTYNCPCLGRGQSDVSESSYAPCLECGHPLRNHFRIGHHPNPNDPNANQVFIPRHQTVKKLSNLLHEQRVVLARGTPSAGKTFLAKSLHTFLRGQGVRSIYIKRFPLSLEDGPTVVQYLAEACHVQGFPVSPLTLMRQEFVFLIDDAHTTYNNSELWLLLNSANQDGLSNIPGPSFCIFSAFGTPDKGVMPQNMGSDLLVFNKSQRLFLSLRFVEEITIFYNREEFDHYVEIHLQRRGSDYEICEVLKDRIFGLTEGQPGLMNAFMDLCDMWYDAFYDEDDDLISFDDYEISRFFQIRGILEEFEVLRQAESTRDEGLLFDPQSEAMLSCLTKGWLHMEEARDGRFKCFFPTTFHSRVVEYLMGVQDLIYATPPTLNRAELELMLGMRNMTIS